MLKTIQIHGFGRYVCGRKPSPNANSILKFSAEEQTFNDVDAIRVAAKSMNPIYAAIENMDGNANFGDCTAVAAHKIQALFDCSAPRTYRAPTLADVLWTYSQTTNPPFNPSTGANDNGTDLGTVLSFWQSHGLYKDGYGKIKTFSSVDATNKVQVQAALNATGILYAGCALPPAWERITGSGFTWAMAGPPDPNAGHCTLIYGFNDVGVFVSTWGMEGTIPWDAVAYYFSGETGELYTVVAA